MFGGRGNWAMVIGGTHIQSNEMSTDPDPQNSF